MSLRKSLSGWVAKRAMQNAIAHLDNHMLRDIGLYDQGYRASQGRESRVFDRFR